MSENCLFCRIARGEIPAAIVYQTEDVVAFRDIDPRAPTHVLIIPREHVASLDEAKDPRMLGELLLAAAEIARKEGLLPEGYRTVVNTGAGAGQSVFHVHAHLLGGRKFTWPPG
jgi:histidine triad (HIT) family protein